jgi:hypothetical protein
MTWSEVVNLCEQVIDNSVKTGWLFFVLNSSNSFRAINRPSIFLSTVVSRCRSIWIRGVRVIGCIKHQHVSAHLNIVNIDCIDYYSYTYDVGPILTLVENEVIDATRTLLGWSDGDGIFCPGEISIKQY